MKLYTAKEERAIVKAATDLMMSVIPDYYYNMMVNDDHWFIVCRDTVPKKEEKLLDHAVAAGDMNPIKYLFDLTEREVLGASILDYQTSGMEGVLYSGFLAIRKAQTSSAEALNP